MDNNDGHGNARAESCSADHVGGAVAISGGAGAGVTVRDGAGGAGGVSGETAAILSMIERAARDPNVDIDKMERLFTMRERMAATAAKAAYLKALSDMQPRMPVIEKAGRIERGKHKQSGEDQKASPYARFEDVIEAIRPVLAEFGFSLSFRIDMSEQGRLKTTGVLGHRDGHSEETTISLPIDSSGGKNDVQAWGSSASYGKRYTTFALLNIVARDEDDDGKAAVAPATITEEQEDKLRDAIEASGSDMAKFCRFYKIEKLGDLPSAKLDGALKLIARKVQ